MSLNNNDDKEGNNAGGSLPGLSTGSDANGLGLMGNLQNGNNSNGGLPSQDGSDANANSNLLGGLSNGLMGDGKQDTNSLMAQQQALMSGSAGTGADGNKDALMNLLAKQGTFNLSALRFGFVSTFF